MIISARSHENGIDILEELSRCPQALQGWVPSSFPPEYALQQYRDSSAEDSLRSSSMRDPLARSIEPASGTVAPGSEERKRRGVLPDGRPSCYSAEKRIERWSVEDVARWLRNAGYLEVADIFETHGVDGAVLLLLDEQDLEHGPLKLRREYVMRVGKLLYKVKKSVMNRLINPNHLGRFASGGFGEMLNSNGSGGQSVMSHAELIPLELPKLHRRQNASSPAPDSRGPYATPELLQAKPKKLIFALMYLFMSIVTTSFMNVITEFRVPDPRRYPPLPDLFLDNLPTLTWGLKAAEVCMLVLVSSMFLIFMVHEHRLIMLRRFCAIAGTGYFLRCLTMTVTSLAVPSPHLKCYDPDRERIAAETFVQGFKDGLFRGGSALAGVQTCGDYMFSGHGFLTSVLVSFVSEYCPAKLSWLRGINWIAAALGAFFILAGHEHYTVDVIIAFYIASRLFSYYHVLANGLMHKLQQSTRVSRMTITYTSDVATCSGFGCFWKVLWRWKGSIYKLVWKDLCAFLALYFALSSVYRFVLDDFSKSYFEKVVLYVNKTYTKLIPLSFVLGFYVSVIMGRWWSQVSSVPWPDMSALYVTSCMTNNKTPRARMFRRTIVRYLNLTFVMSMAKVSPRVKRRFPTLDHMIEAGLLTEHEKKLIGEAEKKTPYSLWFVPIVWCCGIAKQAHREGMIHGERSYLALIEKITQFRGACGTILTYDWISVPLVYTQVVTFAVYAYFLSDLFGNQWIAVNTDDIDLYFPLFPFLQFLFYMGWLKVAEVLINPFGDDDEDFELNWVIDRNIQIAYLVADDLHEQHPEPTKDMHWQEGVPQDIPHTIASEMQKEEPFIDGSTAHITAESMQDDADIAPLRPKTPMFDDANSAAPSPAMGKEGRTPMNGRRSVLRGPSRTNSVTSRPGSRMSRKNFPGSSVLRSMSIFKGKQNPSKLDRSSLAGTSVTSRRSVMTQIGDSEGGDGDWDDVALPVSVAGSYSNTDETHHVLIEIPTNVVKGSPKLHPSSAAGHRRSDSTKSTGTMMFEMDDVGQSQQDSGDRRNKPLETLEEGTEDEPSSTDKS